MRRRRCRVCVRIWSSQTWGDGIEFRIKIHLLYFQRVYHKAKLYGVSSDVTWIQRVTHLAVVGAPYLDELVRGRRREPLSVRGELHC